MTDELPYKTIIHEMPKNWDNEAVEKKYKAKREENKTPIMERAEYAPKHLFNGT